MKWPTLEMKYSLAAEAVNSFAPPRNFQNQNQHCKDDQVLDCVGMGTDAALCPWGLGFHIMMRVTKGGIGFHFQYTLQDVRCPQH